MNSGFPRCPKVFMSAKNDLRSLHSPGKKLTLGGPAKLCCAREDCDVDDEESTASPLFSETPHSSNRAEDLVFSPFAPSIPRSPKRMKTCFRADRYLCRKERAHTHRPTSSTLATSPMKQVPAPRSLHPHFMRASLPSERRNPLFPCDGKVAAQALCHVLQFCSLRQAAELATANKALHRGYRRYMRALMATGLNTAQRLKYWKNIARLAMKGDSFEQFARPCSYCPQDIRNDVLRTPSLMDEKLTEKQQRTMMRVLDALCQCNSDVGYCQGMNYLAGLLVQVVYSEEGCFWLLTHLMRARKLKKLLSPGLAFLQLCCFQLDCLMQHYLPALSEHLKQLGVETEVFAAKWFVTLLSCELPLCILLRVWDLFFAHGWKTIFRVILAILKAARAQLLCADCASIAGLLTSLTLKCDDSLLREASEFKVTRRLLKDLKHLRNSNGKYSLREDDSRKLQWVVTPDLPAPAAGEDGFAVRLLRRVMDLFRPEEREEGRSAVAPQESLETTICSEALPVPPHAQTIMRDFHSPENKEELAVRDLDSGCVHFLDLSQEHCFICGANTHSSRYCAVDVSGALWVFSGEPQV